MVKSIRGWKDELVRAHSGSRICVRTRRLVRRVWPIYGLLSGCERKNGWQVVRVDGRSISLSGPASVGPARWNTDQGAGPDTQLCLEELSSADAVLIVDETVSEEGPLLGGCRAQYSAQPDASRKLGGCVSLLWQ